MHLKHRLHNHSPATPLQTNQPTHKRNDLNRNRNSAAIQHQKVRTQHAGRAVLVQQQQLLGFT